MTDKTYRKYIEKCGLYDFKDKKNSISDMICYMLNRTQSMFKWHNLPDTIPERMLEQYLQIYGFAGVTEVNDDLYCFWGGLGGEPNAYYQPTILTVANPYLNYNAELRIDEECVIVRNDSFYMGLMPLFNKYASMLSENELSMWMATINTRIQSAISAGDDNTKESAQKFLDDLCEGKLGVIADNAFLDSLKTLPLSTTSSTNVLGDLIEQEQYLKASWYNELGLNANYNMKREALNSAESTINNDILFPLVDELLKERQEGADRINKMFGTDIRVELASSWRDNKAEEKAEINERTDTMVSDSDSNNNDDLTDSMDDSVDSGETVGTETVESKPEAEESQPEEVAEDIEEIKEDIEEIKEDIKEVKEGEDSNEEDTDRHID